jgi:Rrf2 family protein
MLALGKRIDYALISLAFLVERDGSYISAREIAQANDLPLPALMQILKGMHHHGVLRSTRGVKGGYQIGVDLETLSLHALSEMLDSADAVSQASEFASAKPGIHLPVQAMRKKLAQFLREVRVSEVVSPGRRIDVPLHRLRIVDRLRDQDQQVCATSTVCAEDRRPVETSSPVTV